jgi:hypothetical protein
MDDTTQEVQELDLTELVNYVNELGQRVEELSLSKNKVYDAFGTEYLEDSATALKGIKFFRTPTFYGFETRLSKDTYEFYLKKYGTVPEIQKDDYYIL